MSTPTDTLITFGSAVKTIDKAAGKVGGYLVLFGAPDNPDLVGEYFDAKTDFGMDWNASPDGTKSALLFHHGQDAALGLKRLGVVPGAVTLKMDDVGVWAEGILDLRDSYEKKILELADAGKLGWSSGTAAHLVTYEQKGKGKAKRIATWPLGLDASLTPTPCEPRTSAIPLKSVEYTSPFGATTDGSVPAVTEGAASVGTSDCAPAGAVRSPASAAVPFKAEFLGEYVEGDMTMAALRTLNDALFYRVLFGAMSNYENAMTPKERVALVKGAVAEFGTMATDLLTKFITEDSAEDATKAAEAMKSLWRPEVTVSAPIAETFEQTLSNALIAGEKALPRIAAVKAIRDSEDRPFSAARHEQIKAVAEVWSKVADETAPRDNTKTASLQSEKDTQAARARRMKMLALSVGVEIPATVS